MNIFYLRILYRITSYNVCYTKLLRLPYHSLNSDGIFIDVNKAWLDTLGYTRDEVIGCWYGDFLHPDWKVHFEERFPKFKSCA